MSRHGRVEQVWRRLESNHELIREQRGPDTTGQTVTGGDDAPQCPLDAEHVEREPRIRLGRRDETGVRQCAPEAPPGEETHVGAIEDAALADVVATLEKRFGRKLVARVEIEPELIGGIRVVVGDEVLDTSVRARLEQMRVALTA